MECMAVRIAQPRLLPFSAANILYPIRAHHAFGIGIHITFFLKRDGLHDANRLVNLCPERPESLSELFQALHRVHRLSDVKLSVFQLYQKQANGLAHSTLGPVLISQNLHAYIRDGSKSHR